MKSTFLTLLCVLLLGSGCVRSVHPFYTDAQLVYDPALLGFWSDADAKNTFTVTGNAEQKEYSAAYTDKDGKVGHFLLHLAKLERPQQPPQLLIDVAPDEPKQLNENDTYKLHLLPLHSFLLVSYNAGSMKVRLMDYDWLDKYLSSKPDAVKHEQFDKDQWVLTAGTAQLQAFILANLSTPGAFGGETELRWIKPIPAP